MSAKLLIRFEMSDSIARLFDLFDNSGQVKAVAETNLRWHYATLFAHRTTARLIDQRITSFR
jgi:hypothetical protein